MNEDDLLFHIPLIPNKGMKSSLLFIYMKEAWHYLVKSYMLLLY